MKQRLTRLLILMCAAVMLVSLFIPQGGCHRDLGPQFLSTPTMTREQRFADIRRNWGLEFQMMQDDIDHALLLRPVSGLSEWTVPQP